MAASGVYPLPPAAPKLVAHPQQKKIFEDVLECVIQLKSEFFEHHQPINDDNVNLQRFCAKFEHLIQIGMREKTSILGRKKDYWDYFCDCLGHAKGSNDGIRYVKNLREYKTSLGRGRAYIRFCLVHQRLADALQQCVGHEKTGLWFMPGSVLRNQKDSTSLISALYDLNSMHFDLSPRGYDLDADWPSFANRTPIMGGSWNIPISRRSSLTSMDTVSQLSVSVGDNPEVEKLHKDLEAAHSIRSEVQEQLGTLQKEKEEASQSAWESQGQVTALQEHLQQCNTQLAALQEKYGDLDINHVKLKLEKEHLEKLLSDERKNGQEQEARRVQQLQGEEEVWKREMREEGERRRRETDRLVEEVAKKTEEEEEMKRTMEGYSSSISGLMSSLKIESGSPKDMHSNLGLIQSWGEGLQTQLDQLTQDSRKSEEKVKETASNEDKLVKEMKERDQEVQSMKENLTASVNNIQSLESELSKKSQECDASKAEILRLEEGARRDAEELKLVKVLNTELKDREKDLNELNLTLKENLPVLAQNLQENKLEVETYMTNISKKDEQIAELQQQVKQLEADAGNQLKSLEDKEKEHVEGNDRLNRKISDTEAALKEKDNKLGVVESQLKAVRTESERFQKEAEVLGSGGQALNQELSLVEARLKSVTAKLKEEESKVMALEVKEKEMVDKVKIGDSLKIKMLKERDESRSKIASLSEKVKEHTKDKEDWEIKHQELAAELNVLRVVLEDKKKELSVEKEKRSVLLTSSGVEADMMEQISILLSQIEEIRKEKEEISSVLEKGRSEWKKEKASLVLDMESLRSKPGEEVQKVEESVNENNKRMFDMNKDVVKALECCKKVLNEKLSVGEEKLIENGEHKLPGGEENVEDVSRNVKILCDKISEVCDSYGEMRMSSQQENGVSSVEEEKSQLLGRVNEALEETHAVKSKLIQTSEQLEASNNSLDSMSSEKDSLQSQLTVMMEEIARHESEKDKLRREVVVLKADCERAEDDCQEKLSEKRKLEVQLEEMEEDLKTALSNKSVLEKTAEGFYSQTEFSQKVLEDSLVDSQNALEALKAEKMDLEEKCSLLEGEKKSSEDRLQVAEEELEHLKVELDAVRNKDSNEEISELKKALAEEKKHNEMEIDTLQSEISGLRFQISSEFIQHETDLETTETLAGSQARVEEMETMLKRLEDENEELMKWKEGTQQNNKFQMQINSQEDLIKHFEKKVRELESNMSEALSSRDKMSANLRELQVSSVKSMEERDKELDLLRSDNDGMKKQILRLIKTKDNLWQKTDALVDEKKRNASGRWQDSSKFNNCLLCKTEFSLFLRKHHCRLCGNIFCWECSDNWMDTSHSSKKTRVCKTCFDQHNNPDSSLMATSILSNESDEDDDRGSRSPSFIHTLEGDVATIREVPPGGDTSQVSSSRASSNDDDLTSNPTTNETDEGKLLQRPPGMSGLPPVEPVAVLEVGTNSPAAGAVDNDDNDGGGDGIDDSFYEVITEAEVIKTMSDYNSPRLRTESKNSNMASSMVLEADDLESGEVNRQNEVWIKAGKQHAVPIKIDEVGAGNTLAWQFSSQPKDIVFSISFAKGDADAIGPSETVEVVAPCKCDAHKQMHKGELTPKRAGIYTLLFDNTYSRVTSKKIHYYLSYHKPQSSP